MIKYVLGFMFNGDKDRVILIRKLKPEWQAGRLNGVGGKVEPKESSKKAMVREFFEETGVKTEEESWRLFCKYGFAGGVLKCFSNSDEIAFQAAKTTEKEVVVKLTTSFVINQHAAIIYNLKWLIPLALDPSVKRTEVSE